MSRKLRDRYEDSPGLFGGGIGLATNYEARCEMCGWIANESCEPEGGEMGEYVREFRFAGKTILDTCGCCERIESEIMSRIKQDIIPWYTRIIEKKATDMIERIEQMQNIEPELDGVLQKLIALMTLQEPSPCAGRDEG